MTFVWKLPVDKKQHSTARSGTVIDSILSSILLYHTMSMRKEFCALFGLVGISSHVERDLSSLPLYHTTSMRKEFFGWFGLVSISSHVE